MRGLYIHIPFCASKCDYCDFYSLNYNKMLVSEYVESLINKIKNLDQEFNTVYFGGGTPSIITGENIALILNEINYSNNAEITLECNPLSYKKDFFDIISAAGVNRLSVGLQSGIDSELKFLTRKHSASDVKNTIELARKSGINNISLDIMLGFDNQTKGSFKETLEFVTGLSPTHISAYILKVEEGTPFDKLANITLTDDEVANLYLYMCEKLTQSNYRQYEISNFCLEGYESRHNLKYWQCDEYIGIGPSAHSFFDGKRYYYPNDIDYFLEGNDFIFDCDGGDIQEQIMLNLRLAKGININEFKNKGFVISNDFLDKCKKYEKLGLMKITQKNISLTRQGFLLSNTIISDLI